ncbi:MAG: MBL fold metallo-hydrolase [Luteolibacter sp.]
MSAVRFENPWPHPPQRFRDILKWKCRLVSEKPMFPQAGDRPAGWMRVTKEQITAPPMEGWRVVWLGHASFLVQGMGVSLLIDPVFSEYCAPVPLPSLRRKVPPPCQFSDLPPIHAVLLTHTHYDHLDLPTLQVLGDQVRLVVPQGHAEWLGEKKFFSNVCEVAWHESLYLGAGVTVRATPAQHFTARGLSDRNRGHWCGWLIEGGGLKLWHAGDSGYCPAFREIGGRYGPIDFGMIPIGAYQPRSIMKPLHMNPEEAVRVFEETRCRRAVAMHWGTFVLTDEPMAEPPLRLKQEVEKRFLPDDSFVAGSVGQVWTVI